MSDPLYALIVRFRNGDLEAHYPGKHRNHAYDGVRSVLSELGFSKKDGLYLGKPGTTEADAMKAVTTLKRKLRWFRKAVHTVKVVMIGAVNDLTSTVRKR